MKKYLLLAMLVTSFVTATAHAEPAHKRSLPARSMKRSTCPMRPLYSSYIGSLILSGCIGATTGSLVRYAEKYLPKDTPSLSLFLALLAWALESEFRNDIITALQQDLNAYQMEYQSGLMYKTAWISSWLAYLNQ